MITQLVDKLRRVFKLNRSVYFQDFYSRVICGHVGQPRVGDVFTTKMVGGKIGVFEVVDVRWCGDPANMYFADVRDVGYWETGESK